MENMWLIWPLWTAAAAACDFTLWAQEGKTNIWAWLEALPLSTSAFTLCLAGSDASKAFTFEDIPSGCVWASSSLTIQSVCEEEPCQQQTIWLLSSTPCQVSGGLVFRNVRLSGARFFDWTCAEDWCTHCLPQKYLVQEGDSYYTVIEHHLVEFDSAYDERQAKCDINNDVFSVSAGRVAFEYCDISDVRFRPYAFVMLGASSLRLFNTSIQRIDTADSFFYELFSIVSSLLLENTYVTGLNRGHAWNPALITDDSRFIAVSVTNLTVVNLTYVDNVYQSFEGYSQIYAEASFFSVTDSSFVTSAGTLLILRSSLPSVFVDCSFMRNYGDFIMELYGSGWPWLARLNWTENQVTSSLVDAETADMDSISFINNSALYEYGLPMITALSAVVSNSTLEGNSAYDDSTSYFWADYFLSKGLLNDNGLSQSKDSLKTSSWCATILQLSFIDELLLRNVTFRDTSVTPCNNGLQIVQKADSEVALLVEDLEVEAAQQIAVEVTLLAQNGSVALLNTRIEKTAELFSCIADSRTSNVLLTFTNVTLQYATGIGIFQSAAVYLENVNAVFSNCSWLHNVGGLAGGLASTNGNLQVRNCVFLNNSCTISAGDLYLSGSSSRPVSLQVSDCSFTASQSTRSAASILLQDNTAEPLSISNSSFAESSSVFGSIVQTSHYSGLLRLFNLTFSRIDSPMALLILVTTPPDPALTSLAFLQVRDCVYLKGIVTRLANGRPAIVSRKNVFAGNKGVAVWISGGSFVDEGSSFVANSANNTLCFFAANSSVHFTSTAFESNRLTNGVSLLRFEQSSYSLVLTACRIADNAADSGTVMGVNAVSLTLEYSQITANRGFRVVLSAVSSSVELQNCTLRDNGDTAQLEDSTALFRNVTLSANAVREGLLSLTASTIVLEDVDIEESSGAGSCVLSEQSRSSASFTRVKVTNTHCSNAAFDVKTSNLTLTNVAMHTVSADQLLRAAQSYISLYSVSFDRCTAASALLTVTQYSLWLRDVRVANCSQVLSVQNADVDIDSCQFASIHTTQTVGMLSCSDCGLLSVTRSYFTNLTAADVASVSANASQIAVQFSAFASLRAAGTGGLRLSASSILISDSNWTYNQGVWGGALQLSGGLATVSGCLFANNTGWTGGAVYWTSAALIWNDSNTLSGNRATYYGSDLASYADHLRVSSGAQNLSSGQMFTGDFRADLLDRLEQVVRVDNSTVAWLQGDMLGGQLQATAFQGQVTFTGFSAVGPPGSTFNITIRTSFTALSHRLSFRTCIVGEAQRNSRCERCAPSTYSLVLGATECKVCPEGATCPGGSELFPLPGYWRPNESFEGMLKCPRSQSCLGHLAHTSTTGVCADRYSGRMCQTCAGGNYRLSRDQCIACPSEAALKAQESGLAVLLFGGWMLQVWASVRGRVHLVVLLHVLIDYMQMTTLVADFDLEWSDILQGFFSLHRYVGNAAQHFVPLGCIYDDAVFVTAAAAALAPIGLAVYFALLWGSVWCICRLFRFSINVRVWYLTSVLVSVLYLQPFIIRSAFQVFSCVEAEEGEWLRTDMDIRCWSKDHQYYAFAAALPTLLLWGAGLLGGLSLALLRYHETAKALNWLNSGHLKGEYLLWEIGIALWKNVLAALFAFSGTLSPSTQGLILVLLFAIGTLFVWESKSYTKRIYRSKALLSWSVVTSTAYAGLYFSFGGVQEEALLVMVLGLHSLFVIRWVAQAVRAKETTTESS